jgi:hypothetical protein
MILSLAIRETIALKTNLKEGERWIHGNSQMPDEPGIQSDEQTDTMLVERQLEVVHEKNLLIPSVQSLRPGDANVAN